MAIKNINTIQNPNDLDYLTGISKEYLVQALANLGQRLGVKGDSILTNEFTFASVLAAENYDPMKYIGFIKNDDDSYVLGVCEKNNVKHVNYSTLIDNTNNYLITSEICKLTKIINNIDSYDTNGRISITNNFYTFSFVGLKYTGTQHAISYEEYICEKVNKFSNKIDSAVRVRRFGYTNSYKLIYIKQSTSAEDKYIVKVYDSIGDVQVQKLAEIANAMDVELLSPESLLENKDFMNFFHTNYTEFVNIEYKEEAGSFIYDFSEYDFSALGYNANDLSKAITYFSYDLSYLYRFVKKYFSEIVYNYNNQQLKRKIIVELFNLISAENNNDIVYIPLDYVFNYAYNSSIPWKIYFNTLDIITKYIKDNQLQNIVFESNNSTWICPTAKPERVSMFNYSVDYDPESQTVVYEINAYKHYTLPYINGENYWVLNDVDSNIYAKGINAGNPNIVIIRTVLNSNTPDIICAASYSNIFSKVAWKKEMVLVKRIKQINNNLQVSNEQSRFIVINCAVPDLSKINNDVIDEYKIALENALIINMSTIDNVVSTSSTLSQYGYTMDEIKDEYGDDGVITTLWHLDSDCSKFDYLKDNYYDDDLKSIQYALDFNYLSNVNNQINYAVKTHIQKYPDKYLHNHVVFNNAIITTKQESTPDSITTYAYPTLRNKQSVDYNSNKKYNVGSEYLNDLNFFIEYNDKVTTIPEDITTVENTEKRYFSATEHNTSNLSDNLVTNTLYSYENSEGGMSLYKEFVPRYNVPILDTAEVLHRNNNVINKINILSFNENGRVYNSYIGTSYSIENKERLIIGSSTKDINLGTETLSYFNGQDGFYVQPILDLNFDTTYVSKDIDVQHNVYVRHDIVNDGISWNHKIVNNIDQYTTTYTLSSKYLYEQDNSYCSSYCGIAKLVPVNNGTPNMNNTDSYIGYLVQQDCLDYALSYDKLYVMNTVETIIGNVSTVTNLYVSDSLYIPVLLNKLHLSNFVEKNDEHIVLMPNMHLTAPNMDVITYEVEYNNAIIKIPVLLKSNSTILHDNGLYNYVSEQNVYTEKIENYTGTEFVGNDLLITYYTTIENNTNNLYINVKEIKRKNNMPYIYKLQTEYK